MAVTSIEIRSRTPFEDGVRFGEAGAYERVDAVLHFAVDPGHALNQGIVDLDCAQRGADGLVHFESDLVVLRPADPGRGSGSLLCSVVNRGRTALVPFSQPPPGMVVTFTPRIEPGDGFLLRRGWTVAFCGWQWDVVRRPGALGLEAPLALDEAGRRATTRVSVQFQPLNERPSEYLAHWPTHPLHNPDRMHQTYPAADLEERGAVLTVADRLGGPKTTIARGAWRFTRYVGGSEGPDARWVTLDGGFEPGRVYEVSYLTDRCPVVGTGLLAIRDTASFLRHGGVDSGNPCAGEVSHAFAHGVSQTGRFLREFLFGGFNVDEAGRKVFDAIYPQVAGARRGEFNFRGAQPSAQYGSGAGQRPPFASVPAGGEPVALLDTQRARGGMPKVFEVNTANEYWRSNAALVHADPDEGRDLDLPVNVRTYTLAGCQHGPGPPLLMRESPATPEQRVANNVNMLSYSPLTRAAVVNLERWVAEGVEPPDSVVPRLQAEELGSRDGVLARFRDLPGAEVPTLLPQLPKQGGDGMYPALVSNVDADLNEVAGIRLPELAVPLATYTGWNPRHPETGGKGQLADMMGSTLPFAATAADRLRTGDPRPSIEERYRDRDHYCARVRAEALRLVEGRLMLEEDVDRLVRGAGRVYDMLTAHDQPK